MIEIESRLIIYSILLLCILLLSLSCNKDETEIDQNGSVFVTVVYNYQVISGSQISTEPST